MSDQFVGEIRMFACNFAPLHWAFCAGQIMPISQNTALFSILGTNYGGDGKSNFGLPDFQGRAPVNQGTSTTGTVYDVGQTDGVENLTLLQNEMPAHTHSVQASSSNKTLANSAGAYFATPPDPTYIPVSPAPTFVPMDPNVVQPVGTGPLPHENRQPFLTLNFCIALQGIFPPRG